MSDTSVDSPCIGVCQMDELQRYCLGCFRTLEEISRWSQMSEEERRKVVLNCSARERAGC